MGSHQSGKSGNLVAQLPWLETPANATCKLEDTDFYKQLCDNGSRRGKFREKLYQFYNETVPFYLPLSYYTMDCMGIQKNSKDGQFWANAAHFLFCSEIQGYEFFYQNVHIDLNEKKFPIDKLVTAFSQKMKNCLLKKIEPATCGTAGEFLLNPWILIQVPFRPAVLHQWVVALLAEALKFELKISDLLTLDSPVALHPHIVKLREMYNVLHSSSHGFLQYFMLFCGQHWLPKSDMELQFQQFPNLLPVLKFVLSSECNDIIMSLKRMSWNPNNTPRRSCQLEALPDCLMRTFDYSHLYSQLFWLDKNEKLVLFVNSEKNQNISWATLLAEDSLTQPITSSDIHDLCRFVDEKIIKTGRIGGVHSDFIFAAVNRSSNILCKLYKLCNIYIGTSREAKISSNDDKYGLIFSIISLEADVRVAEAVNKTVCILYWTIDTIFGERAQDIYINAVDADGPKVSPSSIEASLCSIQESSEFSYENLLAQVKNSCFRPERLIFLDSEMEPLKVAEHFQDRIRIIAFEMIEKQYRSVQSPSPDEYVTYPEFSTVQLLLPCFVASFLDLSSENGVSQATKDLYVSFINRLLRSYEQQPVAQKQFESHMTLTLFEHMQSNLNLRYVQKDMAAQFNDGIKLLLRDSKVANIITSKCMNYLMSCDAQQKDWEKLSHPDHWCQIDCAWYSHLLMFLHRAFDSLSDCGLLHRRQLDLICYCSIQLAWSIFSKKRDELRLQINDHVEFRTHSMFISYFGNNLIPMEGIILQRVPVELRNAAKNLTLQQLQSLNIYYYMNDLKKQQSTYDDRLIFPLDEFCKVFSALRSNDLLGLKLQMASKRNGTEDFSLITYQLAKNNLYYKEVMRSVTPNGKVIMKSPGEITFCPIKHCRWCGQANVKQFRVCPECKDNLDYPDLNFFCSETCEKQCLEKQHIEEHAKYLIMLIGLDINKIVRYE